MNKNYKKNYIILTGILLLVITGCFAFYNIYNIYLERRIKTSPFDDKSSNVVLYKDLNNLTKDLRNDTFLIISYTDSEKIYNNEKAIKKFLNKHNLLDEVIYLNVTTEVNKEGFVNELNSLLGITDKPIEKLPAVVFYQDNTPIYVIDSKEQLISTQDFSKIIDMYELAS